MLLHRGNHAWRLPSYWLPRLDRSFPRKLSTGLFWLSARSLLVQPDDSAVQSLKAILAESHSQQLHIYDVVGSFNQSRPPGLILSLIHDLGGLKERMVEQLHSLPPVSSGVVIDAWQEKLDAMKQDLIEAIKECNTDDDCELPPELQPEPLVTDLPMLPDDGTWVDVDDYDDDEPDYDAFDLKNTPDFDPDQDWEAQFYLDDDDAWIKSDERESFSGARARFYELSSIPRGAHEQDVVRSKEYQGNSPVTTPSTLAPWLLIQQIPCKPDTMNAENDAQFTLMFQRYAYLVSHEHYVRVTCFKQDDASFPRWLLVQEFTSMWDGTEFNLKKKEVEYWWRKNGWSGVIPEFFKLR